MGQKVEAISKNLDKEGLVEISYNSDTEIWDRGECRVQAYSGNPVKDYQYGAVTDKMEKMALSVTSHLKRTFLFSVISIINCRGKKKIRHC